MAQLLAIKGVLSGVFWGLLALVLGSLWSFGPVWVICSGAITGLIVALLILPLRRTSGMWRVAVCVPVLFVAQAIFTFVLTLPIVREGSWPERWIELMLAAWWATVFALHGFIYLPLAVVNVWWVLKGAGFKTSVRSVKESRL